MSKNEKKFSKKSKAQGSDTNLLRVGVIFLAIVSFFTTANGMRDYIFKDNGAVAYAASAAIQGILLALSMNLPRYLHNIFQDDRLPVQDKESKWWKKLIAFIIRLPGKAVQLLKKSFLATCALLLTLVIIFCSSWFSYIYIADTLHKDSWDSDSKLLVQQTYRTELYDAKDYVHNYRVYLEEIVGEKIIQLDEKAQEFADNNTYADIDLEKDKETFVTENGAAAASYMSIVISAMENAFVKDASQNTRDIAVTALEDAKTNIAERMEEIQQNIDTIDENITGYNAQLTRLDNQINRVAEGTDTTALSNSINNYSQLIESASKRQSELQLEYLQLDRALSQIPYYEEALGLFSSTSYVSIRGKLLQLQTDFFETNLDKDQLLEDAKEIFKDLRSAANEAADGKTSEDNSLYGNLLVQMNQLILNLTDYITVKDIEAELDWLIEELHTKNIEDKTDSSSEPVDNVGTMGNGEPRSTDNLEETSDDADLNTNTDGAESDEQAEPALPTDSDAEGMDVSANSALDTDAASSDEKDASVSSNDLSNKDTGDNSETDWKEEWGSKIDNLKAQISAMPKYSPENGTSDGTIKVLSESQISVLEKYDRDASSRTLDDMVRRYVSNHSPVYNGIIYLQSPYRSLALFALLLAVSFDLAGFIFGFVEQGNMPQNKNSNASEPDVNEQTQLSIAKDNQTMLPAFVPKKQKVKKSASTDNIRKQEWTILATLSQYIILTGDYESRDGTYYYKAFKEGVLCNWMVRDTSPYTQGIYIQEKVDNEYTKGVTLPEGEQALLFSQQVGGPKDGVYMNCQLIYDEGSLILSRGEQKTFLANIDEYVPVHSYKPSQGENRTIPSKLLTQKKLDDQSIVVALNEKGTRIAAIYIIEHL